MIGVNDLRRDELCYELEIRGASTDGNMTELAQRLRQRTDHSIAPPKVEEVEVSGAVARIGSVLGELSLLVDVFEASMPTRAQVSRVRARLLHYSNRIADLCGVNGGKDQEIQDVKNLVEDLLDRIQRLTMARGEEVRNRNDPSSGSGDATSGPVMLDTFSLFNKLPNPLVEVMEGAVFSVENVKQVEKTLLFLVKLQDKGELLGLKNKQYFQLLVPLARGPLEGALKEAVQQELPFENFRALLCQKFVSERDLHELKSRLYWSEQQTGETFENYVIRMKQGARCLFPQMEESRIVNNILEGVAPEDRSRMMFCARPENFKELDQLVERVNRVRMIDGKRRKSEEDRRETERNIEGRQTRGRKELICFKCHMPGHIARQCSTKGKGGTA